MTRGKFVTLEGIDGAGKSSHVEFLRGRLQARGARVLLTREPGGTPTSETLRQLVLGTPMDGVSETLLVFAARREHVVQVIEPALREGTWVLCDRFTDSTYAYQHGGRGIEREIVLGLERMVHPQLQPDATFLFDLDPAVAYERQRAQSRSPDVFEREAADFFRRVRDAYLERARAHPQRVHVIDASGTIEEVRARLDDALERALR